MLSPIDWVLHKLRTDPACEGRLVTARELPAREAVYAELDPPLPEALAAALRSLGIARLYAHQAEAIAAARGGDDLVVVTATASGKSLCYNAPVAERMLADPAANALYVFPTKALAQDQLRGLLRLAGAGPALAEVLRAGAYDGDTSPYFKRKIRAGANLILTNPDMLHAGILPNHTQWARFFHGLRFVVMDEIHTYRGVFGSNVACVIRRLLRVCRHYGSRPQFICSSATIANPRELAERLTGRAVRVISREGSPSGRKHFVFWNPPLLDRVTMERKSTNVESQELLVRLVTAGVQSIVFTKARVVAELIYRYARDYIASFNADLAGRIRPYRGGYLPEERRDIERKLFSGELLAVVSTNALELGIDVGGLDASVLVGYPGTIASTWQQAGRAGRGKADSLAVLVAYDDPIDQYMMRHPEYFFGSSPEHAVVDPSNPYILLAHVSCAAAELPFTAADAAAFGEQAPRLLEMLDDARKVKEIDGRWYWSSTESPSRNASLRTISDDTFTIVAADAAAPRGRRVIGQVDSISAPELVYPGAIYLHEGESYLVRTLDLEGKMAHVEQADADYYTQPVLSQSLQVMERLREKDTRGVSVCHGEVTVTWATVMFTKYKFYTGENIGYEKLDLPPQHLETEGLWLKMPPEAMQAVADAGCRPIEGLVGLRNMFMVVLPMISMCDLRDIGGNIEVDPADGRPAIFLYDRYPGGLGFSERGFDCVEQLFAMAREMLSECACRDGCPSCVGLPNVRPPIHQDPDQAGGWPIPSKEAARILLREVLA